MASDIVKPAKHAPLQRLNYILKESGAESALIKEFIGLGAYKDESVYEALSLKEDKANRIQESAVEVTDFKWDRDIWVITENVRQMWFFDSDSKRVGLLGSLTFVLHYLLVSTDSKILRDRETGEFLGLYCLNDKQSKTLEESGTFLSKKIKFYERFVRLSLYLMPHAKSFRIFNELFFLNYDKMRLMLSDEQKRTPELVLLFTSSYTAKRGVGRAMIASVRHELLKKGLHKYYLLTDSSCDYGFYDHLHMERKLNVNLSFNINHIPDYDHYLNCFLEGYVYEDTF